MEGARRSTLVIGATGLVGREIVRLLCADPGVERIVAVTRRPFVGLEDPKLQTKVVDFDALESAAESFAVDQIFCALGTTIKQAGSEPAFRRVDLEYPLTAARLGVEHGANHFLLVSAVGASASSRVFYNRVKGELEDALRTLPYNSITIARPSLLLGNREEHRLGEEIGKRVGWLAVGRYRPVEASAVALALVLAARENRPGMHIIESEDIRRLAAEHTHN
ncbi:MAG TPA: NAD(P)H-binding protein [Gemmatimonadaceae bacterium]|jgi:uncharacterized protein YbjT (DUF2867 family)|nr:NAD(P)H-binding protein [Gemmatimonadaceae bacterium]